MLKHLRYLRYIARHKWYVGRECFRVGLYWRGITHDWHKLLPSEWFPYCEHFYGGEGGDIKRGRDRSGAYPAGDTGEPAFDYAWLLHQKRADHHWQWWVLPLDDGGDKVLPMLVDARLEMVCDWLGASQAITGLRWDGVHDWYAANRDKMRLAPETRRWIDAELTRRL
jgi:hypothetical protein